MNQARRQDADEVGRMLAAVGMLAPGWEGMAASNCCSRGCLCDRLSSTLERLEGLMPVADVLEKRSFVERLVLRLGARGLFDSLTPAERAGLLYSTSAWERPSSRLPSPDPDKGPKEPGFGIWSGQQEPPGKWLYWLFCGGRGVGKSWVLTRFILGRALRFPGCRIALVAKTSGTMVECLEGDSGLLNNSPPWFYPEVEANKRQLVFPNKSVVRWFTAEEPENLRGPNNDFGAIEELCAQPKAAEVWKQLRLTMRRGVHPQIMIATTPTISKLLLSIYEDRHTAVTVGNSYENRANVAQSWLDENVAPMLGTAFGRQEVNGEILMQAEGAMFLRAWFDRQKWCPESFKESKYKRIGVGVDPARTSGHKADSWGIVKAGLREDGLIEVMEDATVNATPDIAVQRAVDLYHEEPSATFMVADVGAGGQMVDGLVRLAGGKGIQIVRKSGTKGKRAWAEGAAVLYGKHLVFNAPGLGKLEEELCTWSDDVKWSPNRMDALAYVVAELMQKGPASHQSAHGQGPARRTW